jgi:hypothetical protein
MQRVVQLFHGCIECGIMLAWLRRLVLVCATVEAKKIMSAAIFPDRKSEATFVALRAGDRRVPVAVLFHAFDSDVCHVLACLFRLPLFLRFQVSKG